MSALRARSLSYLRGGRVVVIDARCDPADTRAPHTVVARIQGHRGAYVVDLMTDGWRCTCRGGLDGCCAHVAAVQLVTGHESAASRDRGGKS